MIFAFIKAELLPLVKLELKLEAARVHQKVVNEHGIDFYNRAIYFCLELGIEPWITLYHWDLPLQLQRNGCWSNREIVSRFGDYVSLCVKALATERKTEWY
ncbi:MAG: family 1 glycosylhydrolase [Ginsengibacter sp.]